MKINSLSTRLLLASALFLPLFLGVSGFFVKAFEDSLQAAENARLRGHIYLLFSLAELVEEEGQLPRLDMPPSLMEPDFERLNSGLYAYIYNRQGELIWRSNSSLLNPAPQHNDFGQVPQVGQLITRTLDIAGNPQFSAHFDIVWEDSAGQGHPYRFAVTQGRENFSSELRDFRTQLWGWVGVLAVLLLIAQAATLHWGLRPLGRLAAALKAMQTGETQDIAGQHPRELQQIIDNLNQVLAREKALRQRYRNSLADLAHSLKTPLAVLQSKLDGDTDTEALQESLKEQLQRMNQVVSYQLQRAVADQQQGLRHQTPVLPLVERLVAALNKVYREKQVEARLDIAPDSLFAGDEADLMELLGNMLDNAYKYCHKRVEVRSETGGGKLRIAIGDDGRGVAPQARTRILQRGQRADTKWPGQGIGLAVVADIVTSYQGDLAIADSPLGGAEFILDLPLAEA